MEDFYIGVLIGTILTLAVIKLMAAIIRHAIEDDVEEKVREGLEKLKARIVPSRIELVNGMLYLYNRETEEFLGQGKDMQELNDVMKARFPDKLFNVAQAELDKYMRKENA